MQQDRTYTGDEVKARRAFHEFLVRVLVALSLRSSKTFGALGLFCCCCFSDLQRLGGFGRTRTSPSPGVVSEVSCGLVLDGRPGTAGYTALAATNAAARSSLLAAPQTTPHLNKAAPPQVSKRQPRTDESSVIVSGGRKEATANIRSATWPPTAPENHVTEQWAA